MSALGLALLLGLTPVLNAQTAPASAPANVSDDVVSLSPFVVNTSKDIGYQANATLSGSRTSTPLKDLANPVDVFTKELMDDLGVKDIQDLTLFATGVAPNAVGDANADGREREVWNQNYMQIRGFKIGTATRNFMELNSVFDAYNSERVEFSKGPNSILFGTGNPGGSSNYLTKTPLLHRNARSIQWGTDQEGTLRLTGDFNQVLIPEKLALRLNLLNQERDFYRKPGYDDQRAGHLVLIYQPLKHTTVTVGYENRDVTRALPRNAFPFDAVTGYLNAGSPAVTNVPASGNNLQINGSATAVPAANYGMRIYGTSWTLDSDGVFRNVSRTATGANYTVNGSGTLTIDPAKLGLPRDYSVGGPNGLSDINWEITEADVTQQIGDLSFSLAFAKSNSIKHIVDSVDNTLKVDPNSFGTNTHLRDYYVETNPFRIDQDNEIVDYRATAAYNLDLTKYNRWFGRHQIAALVERNERDEVWDHGRLVLVGTPAGPINFATTYGATRLQNTAARVSIRDYFDPAAGVFTGRDLRSLIYSNGFTKDGYTAELRRITAFASKKDRTVQKSMLGVLQSRWWDDRVVTTVGLRKDKRDFRTALFENDPDTFERRPVTLLPGAPAGSLNPADAALPSQPTDYLVGISRNYGAVFHATRWLSLNYGYSTNFSPGTESLNIFGQRVPFSTGESKDFGFRLSLLDDAVSVSLQHYVTTEIGSIINGTTVNLPYTQLDAIEDILLENGVTTTNPLNTGSAWTTTDRQAKGEELLIVGRITPAWDVRLSATRNVNRLTNIAPEVKAYFASREALYTQNSGLRALSGVGETIGEKLDQVRTSFGLLATRENVQQFPSSEYEARLTTKYSFRGASWPRLKGLAVGGNYRWASAPIIGYYKNANATFDVNRSYRGEEDHKIDLFLTYERRLSRDLYWKIQVNIDNVLDETDPYPVQAINDADAASYNWVVTKIRPVDGRFVRVTNTISF